MLVQKSKTSLFGGLVRALDRWAVQHPLLRRWLSVLRLGLFQFGMGLSLAPLTGTLNRVLIDELAIPAVAVGFLIAIHYFVSPVRALIGYRSDQQRAQGHWRTPFIVLGAMLTYGGLAVAPFSIILLSGEGLLSFWPAFLICNVIFLFYGIGVNIVETIFLALVSDITEPKERATVLAVLFVMLVLGTVVSSVIMSFLLQNYTHERLIRVMQGSAVLFVVLALLALWNREKLRADGTIATPEGLRVRLSLGESIRKLWEQPLLRNLFLILFVATTGFATHDVLLEPYGGQVLNMSVAATTQLTALWGLAMLVAVVLAGWLLWRGASAVHIILLGCTLGSIGFLVITYASDAALVNPFRLGVWMIGMGRGMFIVASIALVMSLTNLGHAGLFLGLWGVMQAVALGVGTIGGGLGRDVVQHMTGGNVAHGYAAVYGVSLLLLVISMGLVMTLQIERQLNESNVQSGWSGLQDIPADQIVY